MGQWKQKMNDMNRKIDGCDLYTADTGAWNLEKK